MFKKILELLKTTFQGKKVPAKLLEKLATKMAASITDENQVQAEIDKLAEGGLPFTIEEVAEAMAEESAAALANYKKKNPPAKPKPENKGGAEEGAQSENANESQEGDELPPDTPAYIKTLLNQNKQLLQRIEGIEAERTQKTISEKIATHKKIVDAGIDPEFYDEWQKPTREDEIEAFVDKVIAKAEKLGVLGADGGKGDDKADGLGKPAKGTKRKTNDQPLAADSAEIKDLVKEIIV